MSDTKKYKLSEYDEQLSDQAKAGIRSAKAEYERARASGDSVGMAKANAAANRIRKQYGGYEGGSDGSAYYPVKMPEIISRPVYTSAYKEPAKKVRNDILSREEFSYDLESDPMYKLYEKVYTKAGNDAYDRALANGALKTGGMVNTNAATAATQARGYYGTILADKATELYDKAYDRYLDSIKADYDKLDMLESADYTAYNRHRDAVDDYETDRNYSYNMYRDDYNDSQKLISEASELAYRRSRDEAEDSRWRTEFDYAKERDAIADRLSEDKIASDTQKWQQQNEIDRYAALARLIQSVYNKSNIGVNINTIMDLLGM